MKKFTSLFALVVGLCVFNAQAKTVTIHVYFNGDVNQPKVHYWDANGGIDWNQDPSLTLETINNIPFYTYTLNTNASSINIILRNGDKQTDDIYGLTESEYYITYATDQFENNGHNKYYYAAIQSLGISIYPNWNTKVDFEYDDNSKSFSYILDASELTENIVFSLRPNEDWAGYVSGNTASPKAWFEAVDNNEGGYNFSLKHQSYNYDSYLLTAKWTPNSNFKSSWNISVEGLGAVYTVVGDAAIVGSEWNTDDSDNEMTNNGGVYSLNKRVYLNAGQYGFKIITNHKYTESWPENNWIIDIGQNGTYDLIFSFDPSDKQINCQTQLVSSGLVLTDDVPFTESGLENVSSATYERTGITTEWGSLCLPFTFGIDQSNVEFYRLNELSVSDRSINFSKITTGPIEAGHAVLFKLGSQANGTLSISASGEVEVTCDPWLEPDVQYYMEGTFQQLVTNWDVYYISGDNFYYGTNITIKPYRAWIEGQIPSDGDNAPFRINVDDTEGLQFVEQEDGTVKAYYDLQGRKLDGARKGLVIENGKIIMVK